MALGVALAATLWVASHESGDTVEAVKSSGASASSSRAPAPAKAKAEKVMGANEQHEAVRQKLTLAEDITAWKQRAPMGLKTDAELKGWGASLPPPPPPPPPVKQAVVQAPPPPQAPRFPHAWVGRFNDMAVISGTQRTWVLAEGQVIDGKWRVDQIQERQMQLTYLPFKQAQTVAMQTP